ncbi:hypothetical protein KSP39_PZI004450 [Platanthera zijinensis]|uniref:Uncharacterized protein n=1 Tax=Platanthera zijinensis TaxID=2320716 RepID=A0AAP0BXJ1_9ASPA
MKSRSSEPRRSSPAAPSAAASTTFPEIASPFDKTLYFLDDEFCVFHFDLILLYAFDWILKNNRFRYPKGAECDGSFVNKKQNDFPKEEISSRSGSSDSIKKTKTAASLSEYEYFVCIGIAHSLSLCNQGGVWRRGCAAGASAESSLKEDAQTKELQEKDQSSKHSTSVRSHLVFCWSCDVQVAPKLRRKSAEERKNCCRGGAGKQRTGRTFPGGGEKHAQPSNFKRAAAMVRKLVAGDGPGECLLYLLKTCSSYESGFLKKTKLNSNGRTRRAKLPGRINAVSPKPRLIQHYFYPADQFTVTCESISIIHQ